MRNKLFALMALLVVLSMLAAQCGGGATEAPPPEPTEEPAPAETEEAMAEETEEAMAEETEEAMPEEADTENS